MVAQGVLPFRFEAGSTKNGLTSYAGLVPYLDLIEAIELGKSLRTRLGGVIRQRRSGFAEAQLVMSLVLMQPAGGEAVSDIRQLTQDRIGDALFLASSFSCLRQPKLGGYLLPFRRAFENNAPGQGTLSQQPDAPHGFRGRRDFRLSALPSHGSPGGA